MTQSIFGFNLNVSHIYLTVYILPFILHASSRHSIVGFISLVIVFIFVILPAFLHSSNNTSTSTFNSKLYGLNLFDIHIFV